MGNKCVTKLQYTDKQRVDLRYNSFDTRFRINQGNWDFTIGGIFRMHPAYGVTPIEDFWIPGESTFQQLAQDFGYAPEQWVQGFYVDQNWYDISGGDSVLVATSNNEFFNHYFGDAVASFNERELDIVQTRRLSEESATLEELSEKYDISRERVRQIEVRALEKIKEEIQKLMQDKNIIDI